MTMEETFLIVAGVLGSAVAALCAWGWITVKETDISKLPKGDSGTLRTDNQ